MAFEFTTHLPVNQGLISCPARRRQVNVETCLSCRRLMKVRRGAGSAEVSCRPWLAGTARWSILR
jgi:hypothetical protein